MNIPKRYEKAKWDDIPNIIRDRVSATQLEKGFYIYGPVGSGKTHVAYALYKRIVETKRSVWFWNVTDLIHELKLDIDRREKLYIGEGILGFEGILILDDIGAERPTEWVAETLYLIVNKRYNAMLPTIFTSNLPVSDLGDKIGDRIASRIVEMCEIIKLDGGDRRLSTP